MYQRCDILEQQFSLLQNEDMTVYSIQNIALESVFYRIGYITDLKL